MKYMVRVEDEKTIVYTESKNSLVKNVFTSLKKYFGKNFMRISKVLIINLNLQIKSHIYRLYGYCFKWLQGLYF